MRHNRFMRKSNLRIASAALAASIAVGVFGGCSKEDDKIESLTRADYETQAMAQLGFDAAPVTTSSIIVSTDDASSIDESHIVSNHGNTYILQYDSVDEATSARNSIVDNGGIVSDMSVTTVISEGEVDVSQNDDYIDSLSILNGIIIPDVDFSDYIALIDTGADTEYAFSVVGDDTSDGVGHGTGMVNYILEENPNAKIVSIKVSEYGFASPADVYAGFELARQLGVKTINFSMCAPDIEANTIIESEIQSLIEDDITVIGAAGNDNLSATRFIAGSVDGAIVVGAVGLDGVKRITSNYDADYYVVADSTSEAAARYTGMYSANALNNDRVFETAIYDPNDSEFILDESGTFVVADVDWNDVRSWAEGNGRYSGTIPAGTYTGRGNVSAVTAYKKYLSGITCESGPDVAAFNTAMGGLTLQIGCNGAYTSGNGDNYVSGEATIGNCPFTAIVDNDGNMTVYVVKPGRDPLSDTDEFAEIKHYSVSTRASGGGSYVNYIVTVTLDGNWDWSFTIESSGGMSGQALQKEINNRISNHYSGKKSLNINTGGVGTFTLVSYLTGGQKFRGVIGTGGTNTPTPTPPDGGTEAYVYHAGAGKSMDITEWNDLCSAYGEDYVRSHIYIEARLSNSDCIVVTNIGPDGVYGVGPGADGKKGPQYYYGPDGTTRVGPDGRAGTADDNTQYNDDINDDTYYPVAANQVMWSGTLSGLNTHTEGSQIIFEIPVLPTDGVIAAANYGQTTITFNVTETSAFEASHP